jgi:hypothetical protein
MFGVKKEILPVPMDSEVTSPYAWGTLTSLYSPLSNEQTAGLELSIRLRHLGDYQTAFQIYNRLPPAETVLVLAIEKANLYQNQGRYGKLLTQLRTTLNTFTTQDGFPNSACHYLLRISLAEARMYGEGDFRVALEEARAVKKWLQDTPADKYTDVMVFCVWKYHNIVRLCRLSTNWLENTDDGNLPQTREQTAAAAMTHLRKTLQSQGRLVEAQQLVKDEAMLQRSEERLCPFEEILEEMSSPEAQGSEVLQFKSAVFRTFLADQLAEIGEKSSVSLALSAAETMMATNFGSNWESVAPRLKLLLDRVLLESSSSEPSEELVQKHRDLGIRAEALSDYPIMRICLAGALSVSSSVINRAQSSSSQVNIKSVESKILLKKISLEAEQTQSAYYLALAISQLVTRLSTEFKYIQVLDVIKDFESKFPGFDCPLAGERIMSQAHRAAVQLGDGAAQEYEAKTRAFKKQCPFTRKIGTESYVIAEVDDSNYLREWDVGPSEVFWPSFKEVSAKVLLRWCFDALNNGNLPEDGLGSLLLLPPTDCQTNVDVILATITPEQVSNQIYGVEQPLPSDIWDPWFQDIQQMLNDSLLGPSRKQRQHLLKEISHCRAFWVSNSSPDPRSIAFEQWNLREGRNRLDLLLTLDPGIVWQNEIHTEKYNIASSILRHSTLQKAVEEGFITVDMLDEADSIMKGLVEKWIELGNLESLFRGYFLLAQLSWQMFRHFRTVPPTEMLHYLQKQDDIYRSIRSENSLIRSSRSFFARYSVSQAINANFMYTNGIMASVVACIKSSSENRDGLSTAEQALKSKEYEQLVANMIGWMQKSKARALTDLLGLEASIPAALNDELRTSEPAMSMDERRTKLLQGIAVASLNEKLVL